MSETLPAFRKYTSIENHNRAGYLDKLRFAGLHEGEWVVQEKAHGANFSFASTDGEHWVTGKRTSRLAPGEAFFNHDLLLERHRDALGAMWRVLRKHYSEGDGQVTVYGEVLGGSFPGVAPVPGAKRVQRGIHYAPGNHFYAFDIHVGGVGYLGVDEANALFEAGGFAYAKTRFRGTLTEALAQPNVFDTEIPALYGYPILADNVAEGIVIKPVETKYEHQGSRVIIKHKNEHWADAKRNHKARRPPDPEVSAAGEALLATALDYATEARVSSATSKLGEVTRRDFGRLVGMVGKDTHADFVGDHGGALAALVESDRKAITKAIGAQATRLVKAYFVAAAT